MLRDANGDDKADARKVMAKKADVPDIAIHDGNEA
jgi:hypothetical protein